jgi:predicted DNA binding CopG/RHH family protein
MKRKKLPIFKTSDEEAKFWDTHSVADYMDDLEPADEVFMLSPGLASKIRDRAKKRMISIRLAKWEIEKSKVIAKKRKMPYQALIREWIDEGLRAAFARPPTRKTA